MKGLLKLILLLIALLYPLNIRAQSRAELKDYFHLASTEFNVPQPILESIAYVQTKWTQIIYSPEELQNRPPDVQPPLYGIMGLRDDDWFGHSLLDAAQLVGKPADTLKLDPYQNIRGSAALLSKYRDDENHDTVRVTSDLSTWVNVIARFSGIPQNEIAMQFAYHVLQIINIGINENGIIITPEPVNLNKFPESVKSKGYFLKRPRPTGVLENPDYPGAVWDPSPNFSSRGAPIAFVIIHDTEGPFDASVSWLKNPAAQASAHYIIRSVDGYIEQLVHEADKAWHVRCWNPVTVGIEHEGYVSNPSYFTETMYQSSAHLTQYLCNKYSIPEDSLHVFGHDAWTYTWFPSIPFQQYTQYVGTSYATCNDHTDPGKYWNWHHYFDLIHSYDSSVPYVASSIPSPGDTSVPAYSDIVINFSMPMNPNTLQSSFSINPAVNGLLKFSSNYTRFIFSHPDELLKWETAYTVKIDTQAASTNGKKLQYPLELKFTTVPIDTAGPAPIAISPNNGGTTVPQCFAEFVFNEPVDYNSIPGKIFFNDSTGNRIGFSKDLFQVSSKNLTFLAIRSAGQLIHGMKYTVGLLPGIKDYYGNLSRSSYSTTFRIDSSGTKGLVVDGFESSSSAWSLSKGKSDLNGVDSTATDFEVQSNRTFSGSAAGVLHYKFDSSGAYCKILRNPAIDVSSAHSIGIWLFGDNSRNQINFLFTGSSPAPADKVIPIDTINWYGWKYIGMWKDVGDPSTAYFKGFEIKSCSSSLLNQGVIYFDDLQTNGKVTNIVRTQIPQDFYLSQNYPNPFNPSTVILFKIPARNHVLLRIYDVLGRLVRTIADESLDAGEYRYEFNASDLPSGVYICKLTALNRTLTVKMLLMK
ncbi:MAG: N-acetylmuramoyl-L-alanine amidase [Candidatus Kryptoniota bacterium]